MCNPNITLPIPTTGAQPSQEQTCADCALDLLLGTFAFLEGAVLAGSVVALVVLGLPESLIAAPFLLLPLAVGVNWMMVGSQEIIKGVTNNENRHWCMKI